MAGQFQTGDTVQLKSGGPLMTVTGVGEGIGGKAIVSCTWYESAKNKYETGNFDALILEKV